MNTAPSKTYAWAEMTDGTTYEGVRITLATKIQYERTARAQKWDPDEMPFTVAAFMSWHAARLAGKLPADLEFESFLAQVVDAGATTGNDEASDEDDDAEGPTR